MWENFVWEFTLHVETLKPVVGTASLELGNGDYIWQPAEASAHRPVYAVVRRLLLRSPPSLPTLRRNRSPTPISVCDSESVPRMHAQRNKSVSSYSVSAWITSFCAHEVHLTSFQALKSQLPTSPVKIVRVYSVEVMAFLMKSEVRQRNDSQRQEWRQCHTSAHPHVQEKQDSGKYAVRLRRESQRVRQPIPYTHAVHRQIWRSPDARAR